MNGAIGLLVVAECPQTGHDSILKIGLPGIDHVVDGFGASEMRTTTFWLRMRAGDVNGLPGPVIEILAKQSEFPELIGNVLADVGDGPVGSNNYFAVLGVFVRLLFEGAGRHHPTAFVFALRFEINGLALLELLKSRFPKLEMQDFALARQHVVVYAEAVHGFEN